MSSLTPARPSAGPLDHVRLRTASEAMPRTRAIPPPPSLGHQAPLGWRARRAPPPLNDLLCRGWISILRLAKRHRQCSRGSRPACGASATNTGASTPPCSLSRSPRAAAAAAVAGLERRVPGSGRQRQGPRHSRDESTGGAFIIRCGLLYRRGQGEADRLCVPNEGVADTPQE